jgi:hypothetical protein
VPSSSLASSSSTSCSGSDDSRCPGKALVLITQLLLAGIRSGGAAAFRDHYTRLRYALQFCGTL